MVMPFLKISKLVAARLFPRYCDQPVDERSDKVLSTGEEG
jgi:hypothetical protein